MLKKIYLFFYRKLNPAPSNVKIGLQPVSRLFGFDRGTPIDRFYVNKFIEGNADLINGSVLEVGDNQYTKQYGTNVNQSVVIAGSVDDAECFDVDLTNKDSFSLIGVFDCVIATQVLNFIYDIKSAVEGLHSLTKPGGTAIITLAGLAQISRYDADQWGDYWRLTNMSAQRIFEELFETVEVQTFGNVRSATAFMQGLSAEELTSRELEYFDQDYQVVICIKATRAA